MKVLVACEYSGRVRDAFREKGNDAWSCDLLDCESDPKYHIKGDVVNILNDDWDLLIAHPPCTRLTNSGVRWLKEPPQGKTLEQMWSDLDEACEFYKIFQDSPIPKKCIENPVMHKYAKERINKVSNRQIVQPHFFGEEMFKATGYELYGLPNLERTHHMNMPEKGTDEHKRWSWVHRCPPGPDRWKIRSRTPVMIAKAMAEQWG